jgi:hypothetical protein
VAIQPTSISYATDTPEEVVNFENNFYSLVENVWPMSPSAQGPSRVAPYVPEVVATIICSQLNAYPLNPYQLCALPWTSGLNYTVWKPSYVHSTNICESKPIMVNFNDQGKRKSRSLRTGDQFFDDRPNARRAPPVTSSFIPTSVPIAHIELDGQPVQISALRRNANRAFTRSQLEP